MSPPPDLQRCRDSGVVSRHHVAAQAAICIHGSPRHTIASGHGAGPLSFTTVRAHHQRRILLLTSFAASLSKISSKRPLPCRLRRGPVRIHWGDHTMASGIRYPGQGARDQPHASAAVSRANDLTALPHPEGLYQPTPATSCKRWSRVSDGGDATTMSNRLSFPQNWTGRGGGV